MVGSKTIKSKIHSTSNSVKRISKIVLLAAKSVDMSLLKRISAYGHKVIVETGPDKANVRSIMKHHPRVVILDGDLDTSTVLNLSRDIGNSVYRLIAISAKKLEKLPPDWQSCADDIIVKPLRPVDLLARLGVAERLLKLEHELKRRMAKLEKANRLLAQVDVKIKQDLYAVAKIQTSLLPSSLPSIPEASFAWAYKPRMELAGDGLNVFRLDERHIGFYILDVSGTGTQAALLSVSLSRIISPFPMQSTLLKRLADTPPGYILNTPAEVLQSLNAQFPLSIDPIQYFTIFYGVLNVKTLKLRYATAGHPLPVIYRPDIGTISLVGGGYPIGFVENASFDDYEIYLEHGDRVFLFSDGLIEAHAEDGQQFSLKLHEIIKSTYNYDINQCVNEIITQAEAWSDGFQDDVSLLTIDIK